MLVTYLVFWCDIDGSKIFPVTPLCSEQPCCGSVFKSLVCSSNPSRHPATLKILILVTRKVYRTFSPSPVKHARLSRTACWLLMPRFDGNFFGSTLIYHPRTANCTVSPEGFNKLVRFLKSQCLGSLVLGLTHHLTQTASYQRKVKYSKRCACPGFNPWPLRIKHDSMKSRARSKQGRRNLDDAEWNAWHNGE